MKKAFIKCIEYYLPENILDNESINDEFPEWSIDKISSKTGIYRRHIAKKEEFTSDLAINAAENLFKKHSIDRSDIDFVLLCTQSPDYFLPTTACIIQDKLGLSKNIGALDFNLGCSGYVYGLAICKGLISAGVAKNVLFITSETYSKYIHERDKSNRTIFGDAASASLVGTDGICEILDFELGTDGSGADNLIVRNGGSRNPKADDIEREDGYGNIQNDSCLYMNGPEIFSFTSSAVPELVKNTILKNNSVLDKINLFVFHQANKFMLNHLRKLIGISDEKFYLYLENCGNTVSSTIPIALHHAISENRINAGDNILIAGFGVGYSWGGTILRF